MGYTGEGLNIALTSEEDGQQALPAFKWRLERLSLTLRGLTSKMTSGFVFFSSNPSLNHIKIEKRLLLFATNTNIFTLLFEELKTDGKSFIFVVCRLT